MSIFDCPWLGAACDGHLKKKMLAVLDLREHSGQRATTTTGRLYCAAATGWVTALLLVKDGASGAGGRGMVRAPGLSKIWPQYKTLASQPLTKSLLTFFSSSSAHRDPVRDPSCKRTNTYSLPSSRLPSDTSTVSETRIISKTTIPQPSRWVRTYVSPPTTPSSPATASSDATSRCRSYRRARPGISRHPTDSPTGQDSHQRRGHRPRRLWQVDHHWSLDLPVRRYRQAYHREVREGRLVNIIVAEHDTLPSTLHLKSSARSCSRGFVIGGAAFSPLVLDFPFSVRVRGALIRGLISQSQNPVASLTPCHHYHQHTLSTNSTDLINTCGKR